MLFLEGESDREDEQHLEIPVQVGIHGYVIPAARDTVEETLPLVVDLSRRNRVQLMDLYLLLNFCLYV